MDATNGLYYSAVAGSPTTLAWSVLAGAARLEVPPTQEVTPENPAQDPVLLARQCGNGTWATHLQKLRLLRWLDGPRPDGWGTWFC